MKPAMLEGKDIPAKPSIEDHVADPKNDSGLEAPDKYQIEDSFNTLMRAEKIKKDHKMMGHVAKHAEEHGHALDAIKAHVQPAEPPAKSTKDLRALRNKRSLAKRGMKP